MAAPVPKLLPFLQKLCCQKKVKIYSLRKFSSSVQNFFLRNNALTRICHTLRLLCTEQCSPFFTSLTNNPQILKSDFQGFLNTCKFFSVSFDATFFLAYAVPNVTRIWLLWQEEAAKKGVWLSSSPSPQSVSLTFPSDKKNLFFSSIALLLLQHSHLFSFLVVMRKHKKAHYLHLLLPPAALLLSLGLHHVTKPLFLFVWGG